MTDSESLEKSAVAEIPVDSLSDIYNDKAENLAYRKLDFIILPLLFLGFFGLQLDRGNIANALTDTILKDLDITQDTINTGTQVLSAGIIIFEIPSNVLLQRVGAQKWITGQIIAWGLVATFQSFVKSRSTFLATRFLLGACEAGFIPGTLYYLSRWYRKSQYATRNTIFFLGNQFGTACSGAIGSGILTLAGKHGIAGWRWLFLINGVMTIFIGILWLFFLPESPKKCSPLLFPNLKYLDSDSSEIIHNSVLKDDGEKIKNNVRITAKDIINVFSDWRIWQHVLVTFIPMSASTCSVYFPSIVKALGYTEIDVNAMSSVGYFIAMPFQFALAYFSDVMKRRGVAVIIPQILASIFLGLVYGMSTAKSKYTAIVFLQMTLYSYHVLNVTWTSSNCIFPAQRSLALAAVVMSANFSQLAGAPIFGAKYAPTFNTSFIVCIVLSCIGTVFSILVAAGYAFSNQKINKKSPATTEQPKDQIVQEVVNLSPGYISRQRRERRLLYVF